MKHLQTVGLMVVAIVVASVVIFEYKKASEKRALKNLQIAGNEAEAE
ncbi:MAG: hypothetical protein ACPGWR_33865 [Ardenticatenaceae bacterium]